MDEMLLMAILLTFDLSPVIVLAGQNQALEICYRRGKNDEADY
jgi:hypothetical protein